MQEGLIMEKKEKNTQEESFFKRMFADPFRLERCFETGFPKPFVLESEPL